MRPQQDNNQKDNNHPGIAMRRQAAIASIIALIAAALVLLAPISSQAVNTMTTSAPATLRQHGRVTKVVDGDTINVRLPNGNERPVRLIGIDTPEVYPTLECGGYKATRSLKQLLPIGARVRLVSDPTQARVDRYDRLLRYVIRSSTQVDMNRKQVWRGWARVYVYNNDPFTRATSYWKAQDSAKANRRGIWGIC